MGVVPDESNLYPELTGFENLSFCGALYGMGRRDREARGRELLDLLGLTAAAHRKFAGYSKGMKRKLTIAAGLIHAPQILFLDEPTSGIDVASARQIRQLMSDINASGTTIFLTTHYIEEAERLCDRIAFIVSGRIVRIDTVENLMQQAEDRQQREPEAAAQATPSQESTAEVFVACGQRGARGYRHGIEGCHGRFFSRRAKARSILRGWTETPNRSRIAWAMSAGRSASFSDRDRSMKSTTSSLSLCARRGPGFLGTKAARPPCSKAACAL
jgi:ABC-type multidrug transport system ATPase subunit